MERESLPVVVTPIGNALKPLIAGGVAGLVVDITLFPIDTVKTRLQSPAGFFRSGGFRGIYKGLAPAAAGSSPGAALFFCAYETTKGVLAAHATHLNQPMQQVIAASVGEVLACLVRVPVEIAKQRLQTTRSSKSGARTATQILLQAYRTEGLWQGLYRGFGATIMREIPFCMLQYPLWEHLKQQWTPTTGYASTPFSAALCGAVAGGFAAALTTPLDVIKTRIMLSEQKRNLRSILKDIHSRHGYKGLFAGVTPRVLWITLGGAVYFGFYDLASRLLHGNFKPTNE